MSWAPRGQKGSPLSAWCHKGTSTAGVQVTGLWNEALRPGWFVTSSGGFVFGRNSFTNRNGKRSQHSRSKNAGTSGRRCGRREIGTQSVAAGFIKPGCFLPWLTTELPESQQRSCRVLALSPSLSLPCSLSHKLANSVRCSISSKVQAWSVWRVLCGNLWSRVWHVEVARYVLNKSGKHRCTAEVHLGSRVTLPDGNSGLPPPPPT